MSKLNELINKIKVPKSQYNKFGGYSFRNNEDIQTALKPLLLEMNLQEKASTEILEMNGELILGVHICITDPETGECLTGDGYAVIDVNRKGMDKAQATGASQSYASKYAYAQALKLDDTKDADSLNKGQERKPQTKKADKVIYPKSEIDKMIAQKKMSQDRANQLYKNGQIDMTK